MITNLIQRHSGRYSAPFGAARNSHLQACGIDYDTGVDLDPYTLFPKWLQPRTTA